MEINWKNDGDITARRKAAGILKKLFKFSRFNLISSKVLVKI